MASSKLVRCSASALVIRSLPSRDDGSDTGRRVVRNQTVCAVGESFDREWLYVDAPAGRGWCSASYLQEVEGERALPDPAWPKVPRGREEIVRIFGEPGKPVCSAGRVRLPAPLKVSWADQKVEVVSSHKLMEDVFTSVFAEIFESELWGSLENFGGIYSDRSVKGGSKVSTHAWGIAVDLDVLDNQLGKRPSMDPRIIEIFEDHGFVWGGRWSRPDGMHFQYARDY